MHIATWPIKQARKLQDALKCLQFETMTYLPATVETSHTLLIQPLLLPDMLENRNHSQLTGDKQSKLSLV